MTATCATCHEPRVPLIPCADCGRPICEPCSFTREIICVDCNKARAAAADERAALRWYERRGALGEAPSPEIRADLVQRGLIVPSGAGLVLTSAGRAVLADIRCPVTGDAVEDCGHMDADEFNPIELGGEGGFA